jgi:hypothetical protein
VKDNVFEPQFPRFNLRKIQNVVNQNQQGFGRALYRV